MQYNIKYTNIQYGGNSVVDVIKICNNVYECGQINADNEYFKCIRNFLLKKKNIKIVLGAGNINYVNDDEEINDYTRLKNKFDLALTEDGRQIDKKKYDLIGYKMDFNTVEIRKILNKSFFENSISLIAFDGSTVKFWNPGYFLSELKDSNVLTSNGKFYIPDLGPMGGGIMISSSANGYILDKTKRTYIPNEDEIARQVVYMPIPLIRPKIKILQDGIAYTENKDFYMNYNSNALKKYFGIKYNCEIFMNDNNYPINHPLYPMRDYYVLTKL